MDSGHCDVIYTRYTTAYLEEQEKDKESYETPRRQLTSEVGRQTENVTYGGICNSGAIEQAQSSTEEGRGGVTVIERTNLNMLNPQEAREKEDNHRCQPNAEVGTVAGNVSQDNRDATEYREAFRSEIEGDEEEEEDQEEEKKITITVPMEGIESCKAIGCQQRNISFINLTDLKTHYSEQHRRIKIGWQCRNCGKEFPGLHNCRCHIPKCKQRKEIQELAYKCEKCQQQFNTSRGLSTHERHRHPEVRNQKRQEENEDQRKQPGRRNYVWTEEEIEILRTLNQQYANERRPNVEIRNKMPTKSLRQISDKRRELNKQRNNTAQQEVQQQSRQSDENNEQVTQEEEQQTPDEAIQLPNLEIDQIEELEESTWGRRMTSAIKSISLPRSDELHEITKELDVIFTKIEEGENATTLIDKWISESFNPTIQKEEKEETTKKRQKQETKENTQGNKKSRKNNHSRRAQFRYARCQELYDKCPKKLTEIAITGQFSILDEKKEPPKEEEIRKLYKSVWGQKGPTIRSKEVYPESTSILTACPPYTEEEIIKKIRRIKNNTAGGPDKIKKNHLNKKGIGKTLAKLFNILVFTGHYPTLWKINRTTLLPKPKKDLKDARNWRPITIGSLVARIFSGTLDQRLRSFVKICERQKGFIQEDGCKNNIRMIDTIATEMKTEKGGVISVMDISKAFDTIPHSALEPRLKEKRVPTRLVQLIKNMYIDCRTTIRAQNSQGIDIEIQRGVKQGDPLSPLLFNVIMDPIIEEIHRKTKGIEIKNNKVAVLAFADDLILVAKNKRDAQEQVRILDQHLTELGMELATEKCLSFEIVGKNKTWYAKNPVIKIKNAQLPYVSPEQAFRYLGVDITPWNNVQCEGLTEEITQSVRNVAKMKLKPHQKMDLIVQFLLPHFLHKLIAWAPSGMTLKTLDQSIRQEVKKILHLTPSTTDGLIYTTKAHGGLGVPRLEHIIKLAVMKHAIQVEQSNDAALKEAMKEHSMQRKLKTYANSMRINWPTSLQELQTAKKRLKKENTDRWQQLISQGQGVEYFREDKIGNAWLANPTLLKPSRYIDALKLRTNTFGNKTTLHRARMNEDVRCRKCKAQPETLGHIIGGCISVKPMRIRRHDEIKELVATTAGRTCTVFPEPTVRVGGNLLKPDLVIKDQEKLIVVDVTVRYEVGGSLRQAHTEKEEKYKEAAEEIRRKLGCRTMEVLPIVVGARGAMPPKTIKNLEKLKFKQKDLMTVSMIALRSSIEIANAFIDYDNII